MVRWPRAKTAISACNACAQRSLESAQNVDSDKTNAQGQAKGNAEKGVSAQAAKPPKDCSKLSGPEKDKCIQATPAGPVEMDTGEKSKGKSETAKERDRMKDQSSNDNAAPAQSGNSVGRPNDGKEGAATGQGDPNGAMSGGKIPEQSKARSVIPSNVRRPAKRNRCANRARMRIANLPIPERRPPRLTSKRSNATL
jgi:hypothetical protein